MHRKLILLLVVSLLALAGLAGCAEVRLPALPSAAEAQTAICGSLAALTQRLERLARVDAAMSVADIQALKAQVDTAVEAIRAANQVLNRPAITDLTNSYDNLAATINRLPDDAALGAAADNVRSGAAGVLAALAQARTALSCP